VSGTYSSCALFGLMVWHLKGTYTLCQPCCHLWMIAKTAIVSLILLLYRSVCGRVYGASPGSDVKEVDFNNDFSRNLFVSFHVDKYRAYIWLPVHACFYKIAGTSPQRPAARYGALMRLRSSQTISAINMCPLSMQ